MGSDWKEGNIRHRDFQHSDRYEDWEDVKYRRRKPNRKCVSGHDWSILVRTYGGYGGWSPWYVMECSKCHKHEWFRVPPVDIPPVLW